MDGAQSIASVLHGRLQRLALPQLAQHDLTWAQRTPASAPAVATNSPPPSTPEPEPSATS